MSGITPAQSNIQATNGTNPPIESGTGPDPKLEPTPPQIHEVLFETYLEFQTPSKH